MVSRRASPERTTPRKTGLSLSGALETVVLSAFSCSPGEAAELPGVPPCDTLSFPVEAWFLEAVSQEPAKHYQRLESMKVLSEQVRVWTGGVKGRSGKN